MAGDLTLIYSHNKPCPPTRWGVGLPYYWRWPIQQETHMNVDLVLTITSALFVAFVLVVAAGLGNLRMRK